LVLAAICVSLAAGVSSQGFHHGKKVSHHHKAAKIQHLHDLEEDMAAVETAEVDEDVLAKMDSNIASILSDMNNLKDNLENVKKMENSVRAVLSKSGNAEHAVVAEDANEEAKEDVVEEVHEVKATHEIDPVSDDVQVALDSHDNEEEVNSAESILETPAASTNDDDDQSAWALLELENVGDDMNNAVEDDEASVPSMLMNRMKPHSLLQHQKKGDEEGRRFGIAGDGSGLTFEVADDGSTLVHDVPPIPAEFQKPNDGQYRVNPNDPSLSDVPLAQFDPTEVPVDSSIPGTTGKKWSLKVGTNTTTENDLVCVCKRKGAPRGFDRVRCKRHPTPVPTPTPVPIEEPNIIQCVNGTWPRTSDGIDAGTRDILCIYFPVRAPVPTPAPTPTPQEEDYPPECYDPRNEFVAEGVEKRPFDNMLLQEGFEVCGC